MHGDLEHEGDIVLSRCDLVGSASSSGPIGAIVHALMLTRHLSFRLSMVPNGSAQCSRRHGLDG